MYDAELGRWLGVDPECEGHASESPYAFCGGNALSRVDADGRDYWSTTNLAEIRRFLNSILWGNILTVAERKIPFDNFMDALNLAADSKDRRFLNLSETTDIIGSNSISYWMTMCMSIFSYNVLLKTEKMEITKQQL